MWIFWHFIPVFLKASTPLILLYARGLCHSCTALKNSGGLYIWGDDRQYNLSEGLVTEQLPALSHSWAA